MWIVIDKENKQIIGILLPDTPLDIIDKTIKDYHVVPAKEEYGMYEIGTQYQGSLV
jgi:hypothetical protein